MNRFRCTNAIYVGIRIEDSEIEAFRRIEQGHLVARRCEAYVEYSHNYGRMEAQEMSNRLYGKWSKAFSRTLTLRERLHLLESNKSRPIPARKSASARKKIGVWRTRKPYTDNAAFQRRLQDLTIDENALRRAIVFPVTGAARRYVMQKPVWTSLAALLKARAGSTYINTHGEAFGFAGIVAPLIEQTKQSLARDIREVIGKGVPGFIDAEWLLGQAQDVLVEQLNKIVQKTFLLELRVAKLRGQLRGENSSERYQSYLHLLEGPRYVSQIFSEYPVLLEIITSCMAMWRTNVSQFVHRLVQDHSIIEKSLFDGRSIGALREWRIGLGDSHRDGRSVITLGFESGHKLIYKPRSLAIDIGFNQFVAWCNRASPDYPMRTVRTIDRGMYGWCECIAQTDAASPADIEAFFYRQGKFIALFYALQAGDLHCENMIACGSHPVYVDLETLFQVPPAIESVLGSADPSNAAAATVLETFILPVSSKISGSTYIDVSIFGATPDQQLSTTFPGLLDVNTDEAHLGEKAVTLDITAHLPVLEGKVIDSTEYRSSVQAGFIALYDVIANHRESLARDMLQWFAGSTIRHLARPTEIYSVMAHCSLHPDYLRDEMERRALFERLFVDGYGSAWLNRLLEAEIEDIAKLDVPYFYREFDNESIFDSRGRAVSGIRFPSPSRIAVHQLSRLSDSDRNAQVQLIAIALNGEYEGPRASNEAMAAGVQEESRNGALLREARTIALSLLRSTVRSGGNTYWMCQTTGTASTSVTSPNILNLYDGQLGIALFLGIFSSVTGCRDSFTACMESLDTVRRWSRGGRIGFLCNGVFSGSAGYAYALATLGIALKRDELIAEAFHWVATFDPEQNSDDLDVVGGAAGCVLFFNSLLELTYEPAYALHRVRLLQLVARLADRIARGAKPQVTGIGWHVRGVADHALTGFAHGNAGFAAALFVSAKMLGERRYYDLAVQAIAFENHHYSIELGNWRNLLKADTDSPGECAWCHGAPGILLGRLLSKANIAKADPLSLQLDIDIQRALQAGTRASRSDNASLCHGVLGNHDLLTTAEHVLNIAPNTPSRSSQIQFHSQNDWRCGDIARNRVSSVNVSRGLMVGTAGIGYGLLRQAFRQRVPSVLDLSIR